MYGQERERPRFREGRDFCPNLRGRGMDCAVFRWLGCRFQLQDRRTQGQERPQDCLQRRQHRRGAERLRRQGREGR